MTVLLHCKNIEFSHDLNFSSWPQTDENGFGNVLIGWAKVNVNRSFSTSDGAAGIGVVIRDHDGSSVLSSWHAVLQYPVQRMWKLALACQIRMKLALACQIRMSLWSILFNQIASDDASADINTGKSILMGRSNCIEPGLSALTARGANYERALGHQSRVTNHDRWRETWGFGLLDVKMA
uniref:RNase H type-1 domain-containing protein n=2 Tax=Oryza sativa subsp. japonica TaxID=39947 RepID=Q10JA1_ORYSJ|nr:hypothetical protein [Oryza sativa Japonica Group]ABF96737.1 hypothetical protein LOC_Os03g31440 [Oryza sativa Japonica Group]